MYVTVQNPPELTELESRVEELQERERAALDALGLAVLRGLPGEAARAELQRVRTQLEGLYSAHRLVEIDRCSKP